MIKNQAIKLKILFSIIIVLITYSGFAQQVEARRQPASVKAIPQLVVETFKSQYPHVALKGWYITHIVYWQNDYSSDWYNGWYQQRTVVVFTYEKPNYYEVEFSANPAELSRAIYNKYGYWYETRTRIKGLTMPIIEALNASKYADWNLSPVMERIESPAWPVEIYRFNVSKGLKSHILRMDADGNIIQDKY